MARARAEADLSIFLAKTFCDTTFFSSLDDFCIVDENRSVSETYFSFPSGVESEVRSSGFLACDDLVIQGRVLKLRHD
jgi:hypothetical protein